MLRFVVAVLFALEALGYVSQAVQQGAIVYSAEWEPISATGQLVLTGIVVGFWGLGALLATLCAVVLFRSRARRELKGGRWGIRAVVVTCLYGTAFGIVFVYLGLFENGQDLGLSEHEARFNAIFLGLLGAHFLVLSVLGLLAAGVPYRWTAPSRQGDPASV